MTIFSVCLVWLYHLSSFIMYPKNLLLGTGPAQRKKISIKTIALIRTLAAAGLAIGISLPALAENNGANSAPPPAEGSAGMNEEPSVERTEMRDKWQKLSPEERVARRKEMREHWEKMPPEEREALRKKMKEHWVKMAPEEREDQRKEMREHWEKMSPEERDQFKRDMGKQDEK